MAIPSNDENVIRTNRFPAAVPLAAGITTVNKSSVDKHVKYIDLAAKVAMATEPVGGARVAAVLVYRNQVAAIGACKRKSHPFQAKFGRHADAIYPHAETNCIHNALRELDVVDFRRSTMYICRVKYEDRYKRRFILGLAKPCEGCMRALVEFDISSVYYSLDTKGYQQL